MTQTEIAIFPSTSTLTNEDAQPLISYLRNAPNPVVDGNFLVLNPFMNSESIIYTLKEFLWPFHLHRVQLGPNTPTPSPVLLVRFLTYHCANMPHMCPQGSRYRCTMLPCQSITCKSNLRHLHPGRPHHHVSKHLPTLHQENYWTLQEHNRVFIAICWKHKICFVRVCCFLVWVFFPLVHQSSDQCEVDVKPNACMTQWKTNAAKQYVYLNI